MKIIATTADALMSKTEIREIRTGWKHTKTAQKKKKIIIILYYYNNIMDHRRLDNRAFTVLKIQFQNKIIYYIVS